MNRGPNQKQGAGSGWRIDRESEHRPDGLKGFLYWWLESEQNGRRVYMDAAIGVIIVVSVVLILLEVSYRPKEPPVFVRWANAICLGIFAVEYLVRFWINTDFVADVLKDGFAHAFRQKIEWMTQPYSVIDLVAILPFGALRALRTFRFLRLARLLRAFKLARYSSGISGYADELKKRSYELTMLALVSAGSILLGAILIFTVEKPFNARIGTFVDALWWSTVTMTTVGYGDVYPVTSQGRLIAAFLMLSSVSIVGAIGGLITSTVLQRIETLREGRVERLTLKDHIVFCGWTPSARKAAESLAELGILDSQKLVVLTEQKMPEDDYMLKLKGDFTRPRSLRKVNIEDAATAIVFHEMAEDVSHEMADRKALITTLQIESMNRDVHTVTEVFDPANFETVQRKIRGDEVLSKEELDAGLLLNAIEQPGGIPRVVYELSNVTGASVRSVPKGELLPEEAAPPKTVRQLEEALLEHQKPVTLLGYADWNGDVHLNPRGDAKLDEAEHLMVVAEGDVWR